MRRRSIDQIERCGLNLKMTCEPVVR